MNVPPGAVAILLNKDGAVMASAACFDTQKPRGVAVEEAQAYTVRGLLSDKFIQEWTLPDILAVTEGYEARRLVDKLVEKRGWRLVVTRVGSDA